MRSLFALVACLASALPTSAQPKPPVEPDKLPPIVLGIGKADKPHRDLRYSLLPDPLDLTEGNAALLWIRAGRGIQNNTTKFTEKEHAWIDTPRLPLDKLPADEVEEFLKHHLFTLRTAKAASLRKECDWGIPPITLETVDTAFPFEELTYVREIARLLKLQCRLRLKQRKYDEALASIRTTLVLARHVGNQDLLLQSLVGIAIASIAMEEVEEWMSIPGSPNLYWPLTVLPKPLVDVSRAIRYESNTFYRSFPFLREIRNARDRVMTKSELDAFVEHIRKTLSVYQNQKISEFQTRLMLTALASKEYAEGKRVLAARGWNKDKLDKLPVLQVLGLSMAEQYDEWRDEFVKWHTVPYWQSRPHLRDLGRRMQKKLAGQANPFLMLLPAMEQSLEAGVRIQRRVETLRFVESMRAHAVAHSGRPAQKPSDMTELPLPNDPLTGKPFAGYYSFEDGRAVLAVPPMPRHPAWMTQRYVIESPK